MPSSIRVAACWARWSNSSETSRREAWSAGTRDFWLSIHSRYFFTKGKSCSRAWSGPLKAAKRSISIVTS